jgi:hypothetical protein
MAWIAAGAAPAVRLAVIDDPEEGRLRLLIVGGQAGVKSEDVMVNLK